MTSSTSHKHQRIKKGEKRQKATKAHRHPQDQVDQVEPPGPPAEGVHQRNHFRLVGGLLGQVDAQEHPSA